MEYAKSSERLLSEKSTSFTLMENVSTNTQQQNINH